MLRSSGLARTFTTSSRVFVNYGFVGLGQMGQHMARHIYEKLEPVDKLYVYDTVGAASDSFLRKNKTALPDHANQLFKVDKLTDLVSEVGQPLDYVVTMVPEGRHVLGVVSALVEAYKQVTPSKDFHPTVFLDSSTIDIQTSREIHEYVKQQVPQFDFIDTPVSGGVAGARKGTLLFMLSRASMDDISPKLLTLLNKMGANIFPCGASHGTGLAAKLSNNYLLAVTNLAVADSFQLAKSFGLDLKAYAKLVSVSTGKCWAAVENCPIPGAYPLEKQLPADIGYEGGFTTKLTRKDLVLATSCAEKNKRPLFLGDVGRFWYNKACENEKLASRDLGVFYEWLEDMDTTKVEKKVNAAEKATVKV